MNIKKLFLTHYQLPVIGYNSGAFGGLIRGGNDFIGLDQRRTARKTPKKAFRILIAAGGGEHAPVLKDVSHTYRAFTSAGYDVDFVTAKGQPVQFRSSDLTDPVNRWFAEDATSQYKAYHTLKVENSVPGRYVALYFAGIDPAHLNNQWYSQLAELILNNNGVAAGTGPSDEAIIRLNLPFQVEEGYSVPSAVNSSSPSEYGSAAVEAVKADLAWLIHKGKVSDMEYVHPAEIGECIVKRLEI